MKKRLAIILAVVLAFLMVATACSGSSDSSADTSADSSSDSASTEAKADFELTPGVIPTSDVVKIPEGKTIKVGYLSMSESDSFCVLMGEAIQAEAEKYGGQVELLTSDAQYVAATQVTQAEDMVTRGVDVVIIASVDQDACAPAVQKVVDAGIPIIAMNTLVSNVDICTSYVGVDDREAGKVALEILSEALGEEGGTANILQGLLGHPANENRTNGILDSLSDYPNITIGSQQAADWDRNKAMNVAEDWISSGDKIDAILALNDEMAISAANAFQAAGLTDVKIIGIDALDEALELIKAGKMTGTVFQDAKGQGEAALNVAVCAALGVEVDSEYLIPFQPVNASNVDNYMGAHTGE